MVIKSDNIGRICSFVLLDISNEAGETVVLFKAVEGKGKAIPVTGLWGPEGSGRLRLPEF